MGEFKTRDDVVKLFIARAKEISETNHSYQATTLLAIYSAKVFARPELAASSESAFFLHLLSQVNDNDLRHFELIYDHAAALEPKFTTLYACDPIINRSVIQSFNNFPLKNVRLLSWRG